jgi:hypothetical protein
MQQGVAMPFDICSHLIYLTNEGRLKADGSAESTGPSDLERIIYHDLPRVTQDWRNPRVMLYAHGGVISAADAMAYAQSVYPVYLRYEIYPLFFIWRSDPRSTFMDILADTWESLKRVKGSIADNIRDWLIEQSASITVSHFGNR